ncbi:response regulator [Citricoccus sp. SGAir0253]|uniref:response regulator n=1 Tax=Citricoccus sp. SGAir0253 TaxID=2567881 RepID=UPI0010CCDE9C|nr:response regulator [Citricoccus sp. SGAir0253]QCU77191.1 response regulator [Citricoccus sp. SGAir0253]
MTPDQWSQLITAGAAVLSAVAWPLVVVVLVLAVLRRFGADLIAKFNASDQATVQVGSFQLDLRRRVEAGVALAVATEQRGAAPMDPAGIAEAVMAPGTRAGGREGLQGARILWVDDRPENNRYERQVFEALGAAVDTALSTEDALERLRQRGADLVISDMGRPGDRSAGYTLLERLRAGGDRTPYVIYAGAGARQQAAEARERGAAGATDSPGELLSLVTAALSGGPASPRARRS